MSDKIRSLQYAVYKGAGQGKYGAAQFNLLDAREDKPGGVLLEVTSAKGPNIYDWGQKVSFMLSPNDMGKILSFLRSGGGEGKDMSLMHDPGAKTEAQGKIQKYLKLSAPKGTANGFLLSLTQTVGGETRRHMVPFSADEAVIVSTLIQAAIPKAFLWV